MRAELRERLFTYLKGNGFERLWPKVKEKLERLDRVGGRVTLSGLNPIERQAIEGLLAVNLHGKEGCTIDLQQLNTALIQSRFEVDLDECMSLLYPGAFFSRRAERESEKARWVSFSEWAVSLTADPQLRNWVDALSTQVGTVVGYRTFRECYDEFCEIGDSASWRHAAGAINLLLAGKTRPPLRLPIFAAMATGDPHGLDRNNLAGRVFFRGLVALSRPSQPDDGNDWASLETSDGEIVRSVYDRFGIILADISSFVFVAGLSSPTELPIAMTSLAVDQLVIRQNPGSIFVVENPSVFGTLADNCVVPSGSPSGTRGFPHPVICTSGQPSIAALHLLDKVTAAGGYLQYSGDFDVGGLQMAVALAQRYGERFIPWRMQVRDYLRVKHPDLPKLSDAELARLQDMNLPWENGFPATESLLNEMAVRRVKVFQEHIIEQLRSDYVSYAVIR